MASHVTQQSTPHSGQKLFVTGLPESPTRDQFLGVPPSDLKAGVGTRRLVEYVELELRRQGMQWQAACKFGDEGVSWLWEVKELGSTMDEWIKR